MRYPVTEPTLFSPVAKYMIIAASALEKYLTADLEVKACHANGTAWTTLRSAAIRVLADRRLITGRGSSARLKCVILDGTTPELAEDLIEKASRAAAVRGRLQNSQASQSCVSDRWSNHIGTVTVYRQVRGWCFGQAERQRQARADAERRQRVAVR